MSEHRKPILCLDFDGCIHAYSRGWQDGSIYDNVVPGFFEFVESARHVFTLVVYSSRSSTEEGVNAIRDWLTKQHEEYIKPSDELAYIPICEVLAFAYKKPLAFLTIDDRALQFNGNWKDFDPSVLRRFKPWNVS